MEYFGDFVTVVMITAVIKYKILQSDETDLFSVEV